jgi:hypothetical protein
VASNLCGEKTVDLANELLREPQRWGLIEVEHIFFHEFFNQALQLDLKQMRSQLYGQEDPPMPMTLGEAEEAFGKYVGPTMRKIQEQAERKTADTEPLSDEMKKLIAQLLTVKHCMNREKSARLVDELQTLGKEIQALQRNFEKLSLPFSFFEMARDRFLDLAKELHSKSLFDGMSRVDLRSTLKILASPIAEGKGPDNARVFWQIANRLDQLERTLPTYSGSLYMALVCGTPPVCPNVTFHWTMDLGRPMVFRVYSAKARDISGLYRAIIEDYWGLRPRKHRATAAPDVETEWVEEGPLPYLKITLFPRPECIPTPSYVQRILRKEAAGKPFYDRRTKVFDVRKRIRTWATASLKLKCGMGNRDALRFWDAHCIHDRLRYLVEWDGARGSCTASQEVQFEQEIHHVLQRLATMGWQPLP